MFLMSEVPLYPHVSQHAHPGENVTLVCEAWHCFQSVIVDSHARISLPMAHPWSPFPLRRAHPGPGPHMVWITRDARSDDN